MLTRRRKAFTLLELMVAFIIMAILAAVAIPSMQSIVANSQTEADQATALNLANAVYLQNHSSYPAQDVAATQYASEAATYPSVASVTAITGGAEFTFTDGSAPICVSTPTANQGSPAIFACPGTGGTTTTTSSGGSAQLTLIGTTIQNFGPSNAGVMIACGAPGDCVIAFQNSSNQAAYVEETGGVWGTPTQVAGLDVAAGTPGTNPNSSWAIGVSCPSAGNCVLLGDMNSGSFVVTETNGTWGSASALALPSGASPSGATAIACASVGNCIVTGSVVISSASQAFIDIETGGVWAAEQLMSSSGSAAMAGACSTTGLCAIAVNSNNYSVASGYTYNFSTATLSAATNFYTSGAQTVASSCGSDGTCLIGGNVVIGGVSQVFWATESGGTWSSPTTMVAFGSNSTQFVAASCVSNGNCAVAGNYVPASGGPTESFVDIETGGSWAGAQDLASNIMTPTGIVSTTTSSMGASVTSVACASAGNCVVGGQADTTPNSTTSPTTPFQVPYVNAITNGTAGTATELASSLNTTGPGSVGGIACPSSTTGCTAAGYYSGASGVGLFADA